MIIQLSSFIHPAILPRKIRRAVRESPQESPPCAASQKAEAMGLLQLRQGPLLLLFRNGGRYLPFRQAAFRQPSER